VPAGSGEAKTVSGRDIVVLYHSVPFSRNHLSTSCSGCEHDCVEREPVVLLETHQHVQVPAPSSEYTRVNVIVIVEGLLVGIVVQI
jgi:hypothetical protein